MRNLFKSLFICWGVISLTLLIFVGALLAASYFDTAPQLGETQIIGGSNLPTSISINGTEFQLSTLWLLFFAAALNLAVVILIYFYGSKKEIGMKENSSKNKFVVMSSIILVILILGVFFTPVSLAMRMTTILTSLYFILIIASFSLLIATFLSRKKISKAWIKYFAFLPICVAIVPPLFLLGLQAFEPSIDEQCHELICELISSEFIERECVKLNYDRTSFASPTGFKLRRGGGDSYIYDISMLIFKASERKLIIKADNCIALFPLDIPEMPKPQPFSKWQAPLKIMGKNKKIKLELSYKVIKELKE